MRAAEYACWVDFPAWIRPSIRNNCSACWCSPARCRPNQSSYRYGSWLYCLQMLLSVCYWRHLSKEIVRALSARFTARINIWIKNMRNLKILDKLDLRYRQDPGLDLEFRGIHSWRWRRQAAWCSRRASQLNQCSIFCQFRIYCFLTGAIDNVENPVFVRGQQDIKDGLEWRRDLLVVQ